MKHDFELNMKKHRRATLTAPIVAEQFDIGRDDDFGDDFDNARQTARDFLQGIYSRAYSGLPLGDDTTEQASARIPMLGPSTKTTGVIPLFNLPEDLPPQQQKPVESEEPEAKPRKPVESEEPEEEQESNIRVYDEQASLPSNINSSFSSTEINGKTILDQGKFNHIRYDRGFGRV